MNKINRIFTIVLSFLVCCSALVGCKDNSESSSDSSSQEQNSETDKHIVETGDYFVQNGKTEYYIRIANEPTQYESLAAGELNNFLYEATNIRFAIVTDDQALNKQGYYISLGNTAIKEEKGYEFNDSSNSSFEIKTVDKNIYIYGSMKNGYGSVYGVYEFLDIMFDYEFYSEDEIYIKKTDTAKLKEINLREKPDLENRMVSFGHAQDNLYNRLRYRANLYTDIWNAPISAYHNTFSYINPDTYYEDWPNAFATSKTQLCYTGHGDKDTYEFMQNTLFEMHKASIDKNSDKELLRYSITLQDNQSWCACEACTAIISKYGAKSATLILFLNDHIDRLNAYVQSKGLTTEIRLATLAYYAALNAPVLEDENGNYYLANEDIKTRDGIEILFAPLGTNTAVSLKDSENIAVYNNMQKWKMITNRFGFWLYTMNFSEYLAPYDWWTGFKANIDMMNETGAFMYFNQDGATGQYNNPSFQTLKTYLNFKMAWDSDLDMEELTDDFFEHYFKVAATPMKKFYNSLRAKLLEKYKTLGYQGSFLVASSTKYFQFGEIVTWQNMLNEAYEAIEPMKNTHPEIYEKLYKRITLEKVMVDYLDIGIFGGQYSSEVLLAKKIAFKEACTLTKITHIKEHGTIDSLYAKWGIA